MQGQEHSWQIQFSRTKALFGCAVCSGFVCVAILFRFVWKTPDVTNNAWEYQEPAKTILFALIFSLFGFGAVVGSYWIVSPAPLVILDSQLLKYHPLPFRTKVIYWHDVKSITAVRTERRINLHRTVVLTLRITLKPSAMPYAGSRVNPIKLTIGESSFPRNVRVEDLIAHISQHHHVSYAGHISPSHHTHS